MRRRLFLFLCCSLFALCGCRSVEWDYHPIDFLYDTVIDSAIHSDESEYERQERESREFFGS